MLKFNRLFPLFLALLLPVLAFAQGVVIAPQTALKTVNGATSPIAGATITVCAANTAGLPCSPALVSATFKDPALTQPLANPFTADANGNYNFAIATGTYTVTVTASGFAGYTYQLSAPCLPASCAGIGKQMNVQIFPASGTFTIPVGVTSAKVTVVGSGGAGGGSNGANSGMGGGSGGVGIKWLSGLTPGNTLVVTVGTGGTGVSATAGNNGTASSVASGTQVIATITANPGGGGAANISGPAGGGAAGTTGTGGDFNFSGSPGQGFSLATESSTGAASIFGGSTPVQINNTGITASVPGAGGGGAQGVGPFAGGGGANGIVIFEWVN